MKIDIITLHNIMNVGSVFQAWALNKFLIDNGYDCEVIDYVPKYLYHLGIKSEIGKLLNWKSYIIKNKKYNAFVENNMKLTSNKYYSFDDLKTNPPVADLFIAGGDQLWNEFYPCGNDETYQLTFTNKPKISFGTSLGKDSFTKEGLNRLIPNISKFKSIGIREKSGVEILKNNGLTQVLNVCDPVFLLNESEYSGFIEKPICKDKYLFVYLVEASSLLDEAVKMISQELGLKVILCSGFRTKTKCDLHLKDIGPEESLNYLRNASYVLSGSFHASAFSIMMHKPFLTLLPGVNTNARIENLLQLVGLEERMISNKEYLSKSIFDQIDWEDVDNIMTKHINLSKEYLLNSIKDLSKEQL